MKWKCIDPLVTGYERGTFAECSAQTELLPRQSRKNSPEDDSRANNNIRKTLGILSIMVGYWVDDLSWGVVYLLCCLLFLSYDCIHKTLVKVQGIWISSSVAQSQKRATAAPCCQLPRSCLVSQLAGSNGMDPPPCHCCQKPSVVCCQQPAWGKQTKIPFHTSDVTLAHGRLCSAKSLAYTADIKGALLLFVVALTVIKPNYDVVIWIQDLQAIHHLRIGPPSSYYSWSPRSELRLKIFGKGWLFQSQLLSRLLHVLCCFLVNDVVLRGANQIYLRKLFLRHRSAKT